MNEQLKELKRVCDLYEYDYTKALEEVILTATRTRRKLELVIDQLIEEIMMFD